MLYLFILIVLVVAAVFAINAYREGRLDFTGLFRRASTWLGLLSAAQGGAILAYNAAPADLKTTLPDTIGGYLLVGMILLGALTGLATSIEQKWFAPKAPA